MDSPPPGGSALTGLLLRRIPISASQAERVAGEGAAGERGAESVGWVREQMNAELSATNAERPSQAAVTGRGSFF